MIFAVNVVHAGLLQCLLLVCSLTSDHHHIVTIVIVLIR